MKILPRGKKLAVAFMFGLGFLIVCVSTATLITGAMGHFSNATIQTRFGNLMCLAIEQGLAVTVSCCPAFKAFLSDFRQRRNIYLENKPVLAHGVPMGFAQENNTEEEEKM